MARDKYERISLTIHDELNTWLYDLSCEIKKLGGYKIPKTLIIRAFIRAFRECKPNLDLSNLKIDSKGIKNLQIASSQEVEDELVRRFLKVFK